MNRKRWQTAGVVQAIGWVVVMASGALANEKGDRREVMWFAGEDGTRREVKTVQDWERRRAMVVKGMEAVMGELPYAEREKLGKVEVTVGEVVEKDGYRRETVSFPSVYGEVVTAYVYRPTNAKAGERRPGVVAAQPTGEAGKMIVDGAGPKGFAGGRGYGVEMARRGWVVVAPDYPSFGEQKEYDFKNSRFASGTMKAICDNMRCVDLLLQKIPEVDPRKIGIVGHSLGGHNALFTGVFDDRLKAVVTSCGWTPFHHYYGGVKLANWAQERYMPRVVSAYGADPNRMPFDFAELIGAIAPRGVYSCSPVGDENFEVAGVRKGEAEARKVFELYGAPGRFVVAYPEYGHEFGDGERAEAYAFMERVWAEDRKGSQK